MTEHEHECRRCGRGIACNLPGCDVIGPTSLPVWEGDNSGCVCEPHAYVAPAVSRWRTCALCGQGANGSIHRY